MKRLFASLQQMGRSLMLPVSVLPIAGLLLGIGSAKFSWMNPLLAEVMARAGDAVFDNLPLIFAIGVALGFAAFDGVAAVAASVGYFVMLASMGVMAGFRGLKTEPISGLQTLQTGVLGGILIGVVAGLLFKRFHRLELHPSLGFFAGKRSVPIITGMVALLLGVLLSYLWPPLQTQIRALSDYVATGNPAVAVAVWGTLNRALIPFGLHHVWNNPFFFDIGSYVNPADGQVVHGDIQRFLAGDKTAGILGGGYMYTMFGLPAAALAMWQSARPERRKEVGGIMASAAFTSFLTGITEPLEFSFLFVAPMLYALHSLLSGCASFLLFTLGGRVGFTFSHGFIDYIVYFPLHTKPWLIFVLGPLFGIVYYLLFRAAIRWFDLKTPGREGGAEAAPVPQNTDVWLRALGGKANIVEVEACAVTRLRLRLEDPTRVESELFGELGVRGVQNFEGGVMHLLVGEQASSVARSLS
jgi:glucose PTS system EIICB or EIICBA component